MQREEILTALQDLNTGILDLEVELKPLRLQRDALVVEGLRAGVTEMPLCRAAGITRGWLWTLKKRANLPIGPRKKSRRLK